jgi:hypothetical protein
MVCGRSLPEQERMISIIDEEPGTMIVREAGNESRVALQSAAALTRACIGKRNGSNGTFQLLQSGFPFGWDFARDLFIGFCGSCPALVNSQRRGVRVM